MTIPALCNSCARVRYFTNLFEANQADCQCGGTADAGDSFCACSDCQDKARQLMNGQRDARALRVNPDRDWANWTPDRGVIYTGAKE